MAGRRATADGEVVRVIKEAGGIPLLVSNTPELCLGWETSNILNGTTNNPYCLTKTPGGSSGGEVTSYYLIIKILKISFGFSDKARMIGQVSGLRTLVASH